MGKHHVLPASRCRKLQCTDSMAQCSWTMRESLVPTPSQLPRLPVCVDYPSPERQMQVFIHDPLFKWAMTADKAQHAQRGQEAGEDALPGGISRPFSFWCWLQILQQLLQRRTAKCWQMRCSALQMLRTRAAGTGSETADPSCWAQRAVADMGPRRWLMRMQSAPSSASSRSCRAWKQVLPALAREAESVCWKTLAPAPLVPRWWQT